MADNTAEKIPETPAGPDNSNKKPKGGSPMLMGIIFLNTLVLLGVGYFLYSEKMTEIKTPSIEPIEQGADLDKEEGTLEATSGYAVPLDYFLVNLAEDQGQKLFKVQMEFDVDSVDVQEEINKRMPQVRDIIIILLSSKSYNQISTPKGKERLKEEIRDTVNSFLTKGKINKVLFTQFINS